MVPIKKETKFIVEQIKEMTNQTEDEVLTCAIITYLHKHTKPIISLATLTGFGLLHHVLALVNL